MSSPALSAHFARRQPSVIRMAQIEYLARTDGVDAINLAIGNVSLPMHPAMQNRLRELSAPGSPFAGGVVGYTTTKGLPETNRAFLNIIASSGFSTEGLHTQVTDGGSQAMELTILGCCGPAGSPERPLMLIDAAYTNYRSFAERLGRRTVSITRTLGEDGRFALPDATVIREVMAAERPGALVVIPYDNPTGQLYERKTLVELARLCVEHDVWLVSDEAYRELHYKADGLVSIWGLDENEVPGITGRRIGIETASKVWNACGLRIGALVTDNAELSTRAVAENTASLCSNAIGQYIFAGLADVSHAELREWYGRQRAHYGRLLGDFTARVQDLLPGAIVSRPDAAIYSVVDLRNIAPAGFDALAFSRYCAREGAVTVGGKRWTLLSAPMSGFYSVEPGAPNPGRTQLRFAYVAAPEQMAFVPELLAGLFRQYCDR